MQRDPDNWQREGDRCECRSTKLRRNKQTVGIWGNREYKDLWVQRTGSVKHKQHLQHDNCEQIRVGTVGLQDLLGGRRRSVDGLSMWYQTCRNRHHLGQPLQTHSRQETGSNHQCHSLFLTTHSSSLVLLHHLSQHQVSTL